MLSRRCSATPDDIAVLAGLYNHLELLTSLGLPVSLWDAQNTCYAMVRTHFPDMSRRAGEGDSRCQAWTNQFRLLGEKLALDIPA
jgi:hypothetical protein